MCDNLFCAVCRKYGMWPYRYRRQRHTNLMVCVRELQFDQAVWREYCQLQSELAAYFNDVTDHLFSRVMGTGSSSTLDLK